MAAAEAGAGAGGGAAEATGDVAAGRFAVATGFFLFAGFLGGAAAIGCSSAKTGLGASRGPAAAACGATDTVCGWYPLSAKVTENSLPGWTGSSHGVRQFCPSEVFASAPGGSDSIRSASVCGEEPRKFRLGIDVEHAARVKPHAMTAMTRLMIGSPIGWARGHPHPQAATIKPRRTLCNPGAASPATMVSVLKSS